MLNFLQQTQTIVTKLSAELQYYKIILLQIGPKHALYILTITNIELQNIEL